MNVDADDIQTNETDDRGRIYLGTEYANKQVTVAVVDVESERLPRHTRQSFGDVKTVRQGIAVRTGSRSGLTPLRGCRSLYK